MATTTGQEAPAPLATDLREAVVAACGHAFHYKSGLRTIFVNAGVRGELYDSLTEQGVSKFVICRKILLYLDDQGVAGRRIQHAIASELASMRGPMPDADRHQGIEALNQLRRLMPKPTSSSADTDAAIAARRKRSELAKAARTNAAAQSDALRREFNDLAVLQPGQTAQTRGFAFEKFLQRLFGAAHIQYRGAFRVGTVEQIDGAFKLDSRDYLVEAKWQREPPGMSELCALAYKADSKIDGTRGLFISMTAPRDEVLSALPGMTKRLIIMDAQDLAVIVEGLMPLQDALLLKAEKAAHEGVAFYRLGQHPAGRN